MIISQKRKNKVNGNNKKDLELRAKDQCQWRKKRNQDKRGKEDKINRNK